MDFKSAAEQQVRETLGWWIEIEPGPPLQYEWVCAPESSRCLASERELAAYNALVSKTAELLEAEATIREQAERIKRLEHELKLADIVGLEQCERIAELKRAMSDKPTPTLAELLEWSKTHVMTDEEKEAQRQSWARGEAAMNESAVIFRPLSRPPAPRISEEEIQRVTYEIWREASTLKEIAEILRTLNEEKKA